MILVLLQKACQILLYNFAPDLVDQGLRRYDQGKIHLYAAENLGFDEHAHHKGFTHRGRSRVAETLIRQVIINLFLRLEKPLAPVRRHSQINIAKHGIQPIHSIQFLKWRFYDIQSEEIAGACKDGASIICDQLIIRIESHKQGDDFLCPDFMLVSILRMSGL